MPILWLIPLFLMVETEKCFAQISQDPLFILNDTAESLPKDPNRLPYSFPKNQKIEIDSDALGGCLALETKVNFHNFRFSKNEMNPPIDWMPFFFGEFYEYLRGYPQRSRDFASGKESELRKWVLNQSDNSIDPILLYRTSMQLNDGNIWNAMLTIHQLLRNEARFWDPTRYCYASTSQASHIFFNKFIDIRGDLLERGPDFHGDHEGSWYRIWGVFLGRLIDYNSDDFSFKPNVAIETRMGTLILPRFPSISILYHGATMVAGVTVMEASKGGYEGIGYEDDTRKGEIDRVASYAASAMLESLWYGEHPMTQDSCEKRIYLKAVQEK